MSCAAPGLAAALVRVPKYNPPHQTSCGVVASPTHPLVVEWTALDRATLEARAKQGLVAVRYVGCDIEVLPECTAPPQYAYVYTSTTTKRDKVRIQNEDDLYSNLPLGAAKLEGTLRRKGELLVDMTIVGRYSVELASMPRNDLVGSDCARATHVISGLTVGEFDLSAGGRATVGATAGLLIGPAAGGRSSASEEHLAEDGDKRACDRATGSDARPPDGCAAPLRIEVTPVGAFGPAAARLRDERRGRAPAWRRAAPDWRRLRRASCREALHRAVSERGRWRARASRSRAIGSSRNRYSQNAENAWYEVCDASDAEVAG